MKRKHQKREVELKPASPKSESSPDKNQALQPVSFDADRVIADAIERFEAHEAVQRNGEQNAEAEIPSDEELWWNERACNAVQQAAQPFRKAADYLAATNPELGQLNEELEQKLVALAWAEREAKRQAYESYMAKHPEQMPIDKPDRLRAFIERKCTYAKLSVVAHGGTYETFDFTKVNDQAWEYARAIFSTMPPRTPAPPKPDPIGASYYLEALSQWCTEAAHAVAMEPYHKRFEGQPKPTPHGLRMMEVTAEELHRRALQLTIDSMQNGGQTWDETDPLTARVCTMSADQNAIVEAAQARTNTPDEIPQHRWPTLSELLSAVTVSPHTVRRIRVDAGMDVSLKGAAAQRQRFSPHDIDRMIEAAHADSYRERHDIEAAWKKWATPEAARKRQGSGK